MFGRVTRHKIKGSRWPERASEEKQKEQLSLLLDLYPAKTTLRRIREELQQQLSYSISLSPSFSPIETYVPTNILGELCKKKVGFVLN